MYNLYDNLYIPEKNSLYVLDYYSVLVRKTDEPGPKRMKVRRRAQLQASISFRL